MHPLLPNPIPHQHKAVLIKHIAPQTYNSHPQPQHNPHYNQPAQHQYNHQHPKYTQQPHPHQQPQHGHPQQNYQAAPIRGVNIQRNRMK